MRIIKEQDKILAILFDKNLSEGSNPLTDPTWPLQVISLKHPKGKIWPAHTHKPLKRTTDYLLEALFVISGKLKIDLFFEDKLKESFIIKDTEGLMVVNGAIKIEALEDVAMLEVKNGPFLEDKVILNTL